MKYEKTSMTTEEALCRSFAPHFLEPDYRTEGGYTRDKEALAWLQGLADPKVESSEPYIYVKLIDGEECRFTIADWDMTWSATTLTFSSEDDIYTFAINNILYMRRSAADGR